MSGRDSNQSGDADPSQTSAVQKLSALAVLKYSFLGVPISLKHMPYDWREVVPGAFPLAFPFVAALAAAAIGVSGVYSPVPLSWLDFFLDCYLATCALFLLQGIVNGLLFGYCLCVLFVWHRVANDKARCVPAARRVVYFSSFWLCVIVFVWALEWAVYNGAVIPAGLMYFGLFVVFPVAFVLRVLCIFQGVRRETQGSSLAAGLSVVGALDIWFAPFLFRVLWAIFAKR